MGGVILEWVLRFMRIETIVRVENEKVFIRTAEGEVLEYGKDDLSDVLENEVCLIEVDNKTIHIILGKRKTYSMFVSLGEVVDMIRVPKGEPIYVYTVTDKILEYGKNDVTDFLDCTIALIYPSFYGSVAIHLED